MITRRRNGCARTWCLLLLTVCVAAPAYAQNAHLAVIVGLAGEPEHGELFRKWAATLVDTASGRFGIARERIIYLDADAEVKGAAGKSTRQEIELAFGRLAKQATADDLVMIVLIGHGTFDGRVAKFNLPGPDMTAADFAPLMKKLPAQQIVFVNTASASGPFVAELAGPGRTIVAATRSGAEQYSTLFGGFFIDALTNEAADTDKNRRVSILEAFIAAKREVATAYQREGIMLTEHATLDDSGDGKGTHEPGVDGADGRVASIVALGSAADAAPLPADPKLRQLYVERRELERRVESLKLLKSGMDAARYAAEIEKLLTDLALKSQEIRAIEGKK
jgi:Peptidase C13 family